MIVTSASGKLVNEKISREIADSIEWQQKELSRFSAIAASWLLPIATTPAHPWPRSALAARLLVMWVE